MVAIAPSAARLDAQSAARAHLAQRALAGVRRAVAVGWPDAIKSNGGGANAILVRGDAIVEHRVRRLCLWPERRWVHAVRLHDAGIWVANMHAAARPGTPQSPRETALRWAGDAPLVLGGDFNIRQLALDGFACAGGHDVDYVFVRGLSAAVGRRRARPGPAVRSRAGGGHDRRRASATISGDAFSIEPLSNGGSGSYSIAS